MYCINTLHRNINCSKVLNHWITPSFGMLPNFLRATISSGKSVHLPVCMEQLSSHWINLHKILHWALSWKSVKNIQVWLKFDKTIRYFTWRPRNTYDTSLNSSGNDRKLQMKAVEKIKSHIMLYGSKKSCHCWDDYKKYGIM